MKHIWSPWLVCVLALHWVCADVVIYRRVSHDDVEEMEDQPSRFGATISSDGVRGVIIYSNPALACSQVDGPPKNAYNYGNWILLIKRGNCSFEDKVRNAQNSGYNAAIVHNVNSSDLEPMGPDNVPDIVIPSVFIGSDDADMIRRHYLYNSSYYVVIHNLPFDITIHMLLIFSILVGLCFLGMVIFIVIRFFNDRRRRQRHRLPKSTLKQIPIIKFKTNDPYDTCVICMEDYVEGEKLRVLPCMHGYHVKCIDVWLTKRSRVCPVCKRIVFAGSQSNTDVDTDSENENQPLLRNTPSTSAPAAESLFQRTRRHFLGLAESVASSISTTNSNNTGDNDSLRSQSFHSASVDSERASDTRTLLDEPSVNA